MMRAWWEIYYADGNASGRDSRGAKAAAKAAYVNDLVAREQIRSLIDWGCGDGPQQALLEVPDYVGVDWSGTAVAKCLATNPERQFLVYNPASDVRIDLNADACLSMSVIYHLVDDVDYKAYIDRLFASARRFVIVYCTNIEKPSRATHVRHRCWTDDVPPGWELLDCHVDDASLGFYVLGAR